MDKIAIFWFRRDLRLEDNHGLFVALSQNKSVLPLFIFDKNILDDLEDKYDRRINFIHQEVQRLKVEIEDFGGSLFIKYGNPINIFKQLIETYNIQEVYANEDYEPYSIQRDREISDFLQTNRIIFQSYKDQVIFAKNEILKSDATPYIVFTPFSKKWKEKLSSAPIQNFTNDILFHNFLKTKPFPLIDINKLGFSFNKYDFPNREIEYKTLKNYHETRNYPAIDGTSKLSIHLRFGTISIRKLVKTAIETNETFLNELIWREFYMMILYHFPHVVTRAFKQKYDNITWINNEQDFEKWKTGNTGFPIVDAGMRELNETGFMHNRVRMIVASFLIKDLLIDWRWGEQYFAQKLLDFELSSNNGGWQWAAGSGCDAAPYFRIFNPAAQQKKFDKESNYIKKWIPELYSSNYPKPMIDHNYARKRALKVYKNALN
jgi:deoxyribodipyrimidine photo-lyase